MSSFLHGYFSACSSALVGGISLKHSAPLCCDAEHRNKEVLIVALEFKRYDQILTAYRKAACADSGKLEEKVI